MRELIYEVPATAEEAVATVTGVVLLAAFLADTREAA